MMWKASVLLSVVVCVLGDGHGYAKSEQKVVIHHIPVHHGHHGKLTHVGENKPEHHDVYAWSYPSYEFHYKVEDPHTKDFKGHYEWRHGDVVKGEYWLIEPDGSKRTVKYHADDKSGFNAIVNHTPPEYPHIYKKPELPVPEMKPVTEENREEEKREEEPEEQRQEPKPKHEEKPYKIVYEIKQKHPIHKKHHEEPKHHKHVEIKYEITKEEPIPKPKSKPIVHHEIYQIHEHKPKHEERKPKYEERMPKYEEHKPKYEENEHKVYVPIINLQKPRVEPRRHQHHEEHQHYNVHNPRHRGHQKFKAEEESEY